MAFKNTARKYSNPPGCREVERYAWDCDLQEWTPMDVLPADGMQEVMGSKPLSSTQVRKHISKSLPVSGAPVRGILRGKTGLDTALLGRMTSTNVCQGQPGQGAAPS
jgi:hypothetical protein